MHRTSSITVPHRTGTERRPWLGWVCAAALLCPHAGHAQGVRFDVPPQSLGTALDSLAREAGLQLLYPPEAVEGLTTRGVQGEYTPQEAVKRLLEGSGLHYEFLKDNTVTVSDAGKESDSSPVKDPNPEDQIVTLPPLTVTASPGQDTSYNPPNAYTATKTDTPIMETPLSVQVVTKQVLQDQQAFRLQDALKNVSGVQQYSTNGGTLGGGDTFVVRGFQLGSGSGYAARYRNGVRVANSNADFANVDRIEVLKGPASGLYGRIEPGGLINVVTKKPSTEPYYSIEQRFGSYDYYRTEANATGPLTQDGSLAYRLDLSYLDTESFRDFFTDDRVFVAPSLTWKPVDSTDFNLSVEYLDEDRFYDSGIPVIGNRIAPVPISRSFSQEGLTDKNSYWLVDFNGTHRFNDNWKLRSGVLASEGDLGFQEVYVEDKAAANGDATRGAWFGGGDYDQQTVYLDLTGKFETYVSSIPC